MEKFPFAIVLVGLLITAFFVSTFQYYQNGRYSGSSELQEKEMTEAEKQLAAQVAELDELRAQQKRSIRTTDQQIEELDTARAALGSQ